MARRKTGNAFMTPHAINRWRKRAKSTKKMTAVRDKIKRRLAIEIQKGARVTKRGVVQIEIESDLAFLKHQKGLDIWPETLREITLPRRTLEVANKGEEGGEYLGPGDPRLKQLRVIDGSAQKTGAERSAKQPCDDQKEASLYHSSIQGQG